MNMTNYIDLSISQLVNEYNEKIEMEIIKYGDHYKVIVTICQEVASIKEFIVVGTDRKSKGRAAKKALMELYREAYPELFEGVQV